MRAAGFALAPVSALALALALGACNRQGPPSAEYQEAHGQFVALYGKHLEDAYLLPEMAGIEAKLEEVDTGSRHASEAKALLTRIRSGRERRQAQLEDRQEAVAEARKLPPGAGRTDSPEPPAPAAPPVTKDAGTDAGADGEQPQVGMAIREVTRRFGECFLAGERLEVADRGARGTWMLRDTLFCQQRHPGFAGRLLVEEEGRVLAIVEQSSVEYGDGAPGDAGR